ncbi:DUF1661 domain-containing protein [Porphyromonas gingivalis]
MISFWFEIFFCSRTKIKKFSRHVFRSMKQKISRT